MQYHEVKINIEFAPLKSLYWAADITSGVGSLAYSANANGLSVGDLVSASLYVDYVYLDTDERRRFAQVSHEYLLLSKRSKVTTCQRADTVDIKKCRYSARRCEVFQPAVVCCY